MADASSRRKFLQHAGAVLGVGWLTLNAGIVLAAADRAVSRRVEGAPWRSLSPAEVRRLEAVADQVYPPDDVPEFSAGAVAIGAVRFMDEAFAGFMAGALPLVRDGLAELDGLAAAREPAAGSFADLPFDAQTEVLREIEDGPFFGVVHFLTLCGVFAMPSYGGNRDGEGWRQIGFDLRHAWTPPFGHYDAAATEEGDGGRA
jgi:hypothetical protein